MSEAAEFYGELVGGPPPAMRTIRNWIKKGVRGVRLPVVPRGSHFRIRKCDIVEFQNRLEDSLRE